MADAPGGNSGCGETHDISPEHESRVFCAICRNGTTQKTASRAIREILAFTKGTDLAWIDYVVDDVEKDVREAAQVLGFSDLLIKNLVKSPKTAYEDFDDELGLLLPAIYMQGFDVRLEPLYILIRKNVIVTLHSREVKRFFRMRRYAETLMRKIPSEILPNDKITPLLIRIIDQNNSRNFDYLSGIEEHGDALSRELADPKTRVKSSAPRSTR